MVNNKSNKRKSKRPKEKWYWPKPINDIDRIIDAVNTIKDMEGEAWSEESGTQTQMLELIVAKKLHISANPMGARNWMSVFQLYGLAYVRHENGKRIITITPVGRSLQKSTSLTRRQIIANQFKKLQFRNPSLSHLPITMRVNPLYVTLKVINELGYLTKQEMAYFVMCIQNHKEIESTIEKIKTFRKSKKTPKLGSDTLEILRDYANRILRKSYVYAEYLIEKPQDTYIINTKKKNEIEKFLLEEPEIHEEFIDNKGWNNWFEFYGSLTKSRRTPAGSIPSSQYQATKLTQLIQKEHNSNKVTKISFRKIEEEIQLTHEQIINLLKKPSTRKNYPELRVATVRGNYLVIGETNKEKELRFSSKVKPFEKIIEGARYSDDFVKFEEDVKEIFEELNFMAIHHGSRESGTEIEDVEVRHDGGKIMNDFWCILVDAKARTGAFSIDTASRRAMETYFNNHQSNLGEKNPYQCKALSFISSQFAGDVEKSLKKLRKKTNVGCSCITAEDLLYLLDFYKNNPGKIQSEQILELFSSDQQIIKPNIDALLEQ